MKIPIAKPYFGDEEVAAAAMPLRSGWLVQGPHVAEFEQRFAKFVSAPHAVALSNGTTALHVAYAAMGLGEGDEVIVPAFTWIATPNAVLYCGAKPVFCDIELTSYNIDIDRIEITPRTRGIVPVHLFGLCAEMDPILELARNQCWVVEDAACAFGATYRGRHCGTFADAATFSFHPRKSITTGEGGMVTTADAHTAQLARSLRDHGAGQREPGTPSFLLTDFDVLGFNYRMTDVQGAIGCAQLDRAEWILAERRRVARRYDEELRDLEWLRLPTTPAHMEHAYQAYVCLFAPETPTLANVDALEKRRNQLMLQLDARGIATRQGTHAPVLQSLYRKQYGIDPTRFPNAVIAEKLSIALPLYPQMTDDEQSYVIEAIREIGPC
ncbi:MAG TPA: DegT/DnrJ/EryC1/StrS family aminotransferase [Thermoanaerobaculia bacterium]|nr:DegT/DnrJ/EryC1/StrS family aminotransferase [Thermoanaerobaculia bacterium]